MSPLRILVPGQPRPYDRTAIGRGGRSGGAMTRTTPPAVRAWRKHVKACAQVAMMGAGVEPYPKGEALHVQIGVFTKDLRQGDVDNYAKALLDACNAVVWHDDKQVSYLEVFRSVSRENPRALIVVRALGGLRPHWSDQEPGETPRKARRIEPTNASLPARRNIEPCPRCAVVNGHFGSCPELGR